MRIAVTGATGYVGRFIVARALADGREVVALTRNTPGGPVEHLPFDLGGPPLSLSSIDLLVHAAFEHEPGRYRGGEGDDPESFVARNLRGTCRLFDAAAAAGVPRIAFLSSRAVFDGLPDGTPLPEDLSPAPASLYGRAKRDAEEHLATLPIIGWGLRATGVFGLEPRDIPRERPAPWRKWESLLKDAAAGRVPEARRGTEVHGADLADALSLLIRHDAPPGPVHVSDLILDTREILIEAARALGRDLPLPPHSDAPISILESRTLDRLGWRPTGRARLAQEMPALLKAYGLI